MTGSLATGHCAEKKSGGTSSAEARRTTAATDGRSRPDSIWLKAGAERALPVSATTWRCVSPRNDPPEQHDETRRWMLDLLPKLKDLFEPLVAEILANAAAQDQEPESNLIDSGAETT